MVLWLTSVLGVKLFDLKLVYTPLAAVGNCRKTKNLPASSPIPATSAQNTAWCRVAALPQSTLQRLYALIRELGMTALVEAHSEEEVARAVDLGAQLIGVNARDLSTFELDRELFGRVADQIPAGVIRVAESAVQGIADVERYREAGADVVLVGEALVTGGDPVATLKSYLSV